MSQERILAILASDAPDGAKVAAIASLITGKTTARELAEVCNVKLRTMERHNTDAKSLVRKSAEVSQEPLRDIAEGVRKSAGGSTQICVVSQPADSRAGATMELPSVINNSLEREGEERSLDRDVPHMNGKGFIISAKHDVYIPTGTITKWRAKYTSIPDLEATISGLSAHILSKGHMHAGWQCPEGWMVKLIAEENTKAENIAKEARARENRATGGKTSDKAAAAQNFQQLLERSMAGSA